MLFASRSGAEWSAFDQAAAAAKQGQPSAAALAAST